MIWTLDYKFKCHTSACEEFLTFVEHNKWEKDSIYTWKGRTPSLAYPITMIPNTMKNNPHVKIK